MRSITFLSLLLAATSSVLALAGSPEPSASAPLQSREIEGARFDKRGILHWENAELPLTTKRDGEKSFTASFGLMLERDGPLTEAELEKRDSIFEPEGRRRTRDLGEPFNVKLGMNKRGEIIGLKRYFQEHTSPASNLVKRRHRHHHRHHHKKHRSHRKKQKAHHKKHKAHHKKHRSHSKKHKGHLSTKGVQLSTQSGSSFSAVSTWYTGRDLLNPFCDRQSSWTPTDHSLVVAPTMDWSDRPACGSFLRITAPGSGKSVVVRVVDVCGGCAPGVPHVDLSLGAFTKLWDQDVGLVNGVHVQTLSAPPFDNWDGEMTSLYGPPSL